MKFDALKTRQTKYGGYMLTYTLVVVAIIVAVNYLGERYNKTYDATENKLYSLSDQTLKVLDDLEEDLTIYYFDRSPEFERVRDTLVRYENASHAVSVQYIDPDSRPELAREMNVRTYGTLYVELAGNREEAQTVEEEDITNAIIRVKKGQEKTACFLTGHGEASLDDNEREGFAGVKEETEGANYTTKTVSLLENPEVPEDCTLLVFAGPENDYLEPEIEIIKDYVENGGRALFMLDNESSPRLAELVSEWGIRVKDDVVVDLTGIGQLFGGGPLTPLVANYGAHPIAEVMGNTATFFPLVRTVEPGDSVDGWDVETLFSTTEGSFATEELDVVEGELQRDPGKETEGPISIAVAATYDVPDEASEDSESSAEPESDADSDEEDQTEEEDQQARVVVVGTSIFARNNFLGRGSNLDLFLNMLNWLSSDEDLISIRPKDPENTPLDLTQSDMSRLFWLTVVGLPAVIIFAGVRVWWLRR